MNTSRFIKLIIAGVLAMLLAGLVLYIKIPKNDAKINELQVEHKPEKTTEEKTREDISAPASITENIQPEISAEVQATISVPASITENTQSEVSRDIIDSVSAPAK